MFIETVSELYFFAGYLTGLFTALLVVAFTLFLSR